MASGEPYALRLDMAAALARAGQLTWTESGAGPDGETGIIAADPAAWGDVVLARKDAPASYHLAVTVDDAAQGVTDVVRGRDLFHATACTGYYRRCLVFRRRATTTTASSSMPTAASCRNRRSRPACASCVRRELRLPTFAAGSGSIEAGFRAMVGRG